MFTTEFEKTAAFGSADKPNGDYKPKFTRDDTRSTMSHEMEGTKSPDDKGKKKKTKTPKQESDEKKMPNGEKKNPHVREEYPDFPGSRKQESSPGSIYNENSVL